MTIQLVAAVCPVCYYGVASPFFDGGMQTLATLGWPKSQQLAQAMPGLPHDFVQCPKCTHVWNRSFSYEAIPYQDNPNRMFNQGGIWKGHLATTKDLVIGRLPSSATVLDIGCGEGHFVREIANSLNGLGRFVGFDPNASSESGRNVEFHARYFEPLKDIQVFKPDCIVIRHVLEHLTNPAALLQEMAWGAAALEKPVLLFAETPCIDRVFETERVADFFYEHPSHFTLESFRTLMESAGEIVEMAHGYDREVIYALVRLGVPNDNCSRAKKSMDFYQRAQVNGTNIRRQLDQLAKDDKRIAIWGGTGKAAAFIHHFWADAVRFPLVVDSDPDKIGTFVPGSGQIIEFRDVLKKDPAEIVIIPTQWRAKDIIAEMVREGISCSKVLIEHQGSLVDFDADEHPYQ